MFLKKDRTDKQITTIQIKQNQQVGRLQIFSHVSNLKNKFENYRKYVLPNFKKAVLEFLIFW